MEIKVLGTGCTTCKTLFNNVSEVAAQVAPDATVVKEENLLKIMSYNILSLPALVINEKVVAKGPMTIAQIKETILKNM